MAKVSDIGGKRLIGLTPNAWVKWVTQQTNVVAVDIIGSDFQWVSRENDVLIKAYSPEIGEFLIANELQLRYTAKMPLRMRAYAALAEEKYRLPVYPVLINILQPSQATVIPSSFTSEVMGLKVRQDYAVINLWQVEADLIFEMELDALLPFVPVMKGGGTPQFVQRALVELQKNNKLVELESLLGFFASFVLETDVIQQIMRWDMTVLRESPWYQEILKEGESRGLEQGLEKGLEQGLEQHRSLIIRQLTRKVGSIAPNLTTQIQSLSLEKIESLGEALLDFSQLEDLEQWLEEN